MPKVRCPREAFPERWQCLPILFEHIAGHFKPMRSQGHVKWMKSHIGFEGPKAARGFASVHQGEGEAPIGVSIGAEY